MRMLRIATVLAVAVSVTPVSADSWGHEMTFDGATTVFGSADLMVPSATGGLKWIGGVMVVAQSVGVVDEGEGPQARGWYEILVLDERHPDRWTLTRGVLAEGQMDVSARVDRVDLDLPLGDGTTAELAFEKDGPFRPTFTGFGSAVYSNGRSYSISMGMMAPRLARVGGTLRGAMVRFHPFDDAWISNESRGRTASGDRSEVPAEGDVVVSASTGDLTMTRVTDLPPGEAQAWTYENEPADNPCRAALRFEYARDEATSLALLDTAECARRYDDVDGALDSAWLANAISRDDAIRDEPAHAEERVTCAGDELCAARPRLPHRRIEVSGYWLDLDGGGTGTWSEESSFSFGWGWRISGFLCTGAVVVASC